MRELNGNEKKFVMGMGIVVILGAVVLCGISIGRGSGIPTTAPLLIIIGSLALFFASRKS